jgi:hypothetical protein
MRFWFFIASTLIRLVAYEQNPTHRPSLRDLTRVHFDEDECVLDIRIGLAKRNSRLDAISFDT